jgi:homoserine/homoserine lactone efflux protein
MQSTFIIFCLSIVVISLIPGLNVMLVISQSIQGGLRSSLRSILGVVTGNLIYLIISLFGLGAILLRFPSAFQVIKIAGILFIIHSAWLLFKAGFSVSQNSTAHEPHQSSERNFVQGVFTILSNPKAFIFWITFLPGFVKTDANVMAQIALLGATAIFIDTIILILYGYLASMIAPWLQGKSQRLQFLISGLILVAVAIWLALS